MSPRHEGTGGEPRWGRIHDSDLKVEGSWLGRGGSPFCAARGANEVLTSSNPGDTEIREESKDCLFPWLFNLMNRPQTKPNQRTGLPLSQYGKLGGRHRH